MSPPLSEASTWLLAGVPAIALVVSVALILVLRPWLIRYALARPSARGLHTIPTPQGGGLAVLTGGIVAVGIGAILMPLEASERLRLAVVFAVATALAGLGFLDDIRPLPAWPRLLLQVGLMAVGIGALPETARPLPFLPFGIERGLLVVGGAWFINLTNFMDGMDWMMVVEVVPLAAALALFGTAGQLPAYTGLIALGLLGGMLGFAPFNRPPAKLFLGDVGSLPIGFLVAWCLISLAGQRHDALANLGAAIVLPLYFIADSGWTLVARLVRGERIWLPHRLHFYQRAAARDASSWPVLLRVGATNAVLMIVAAVIIGLHSIAATFLGLSLAVLAVATLLYVLSLRAAGRQTK